MAQASKRNVLRTLSTTGPAPSMGGRPGRYCPARADVPLPSSRLQCALRAAWKSAQNQGSISSAPAKVTTVGPVVGMGWKSLEVEEVIGGFLHTNGLTDSKAINYMAQAVRLEGLSGTMDAFPPD